MKLLVALMVALPLALIAPPAAAVASQDLVVSNVAYHWRPVPNPDFDPTCEHQGCGTKGNPVLLHTIVDFDLANTGTHGVTGSLSVTLAPTVGSQSASAEGIDAGASKHYTVDVTSLYPFPSLCVSASARADDGTSLSSNRACANVSEPDLSALLP